MRLAHCSDLHLLSHDGAGLASLLNKRWIGAANLLTNRSRHYHVAAFEDMITDLNALGVEHVLCTGDVTNLALRQEFTFARGLFDRLANGPTGVTVIPGNHDAYVAEGVPLFAEIFAPYCAPDPDWMWTEADRHGDDDSLAWPIVRVRGELAIIGVSTSRATPWFTAHGRVGEGQLARLEHALADPRLAGKVRVVAIHHPPAGKRARSRIRGLRDHEAFAAVIARTGADLIVHGHEHRDMAEALPGPAGDVPVRGVPSGTYEHDRRKPGLRPGAQQREALRSDDERTARYRIFQVEAGKLRSDHVRVWDRATRCFRDDTPPALVTLRANPAT